MKHLLRYVPLIALVLALLPPAARAATLEVTTVADNGPGSLRQAIATAASGDTITFNLNTFPPADPAIIFVRSVLPTLSRNNVTIDASNAGVILDGSQAPDNVNGLVLGANNCTIRGLTIQHFSGGAYHNSNGIFIQPGASGNVIGGDRAIGGGPNGQGNRIAANRANGIEIWGNNTIVRGNYIGVDQSGVRPHGNLLSGISIRQGARNNTVGGTSSADRNIVSGNHNHGIYLSDAGTSGNRVLGNYIGTDREGSAIIGQLLNGITIANGATGNIIGDGAAAGLNVISGSAYNGVRIEGDTTSNNQVLGNYIGTNANGTSPLPNRLHGVEIAAGAHHNRVGAPGQGNLLSGNLNHGLVITAMAHDNIVQGNRIGMNAAGSASLGNQENGGIDIADGSDRNIIGGLEPGAGNIISGNQTDGIALFDNTGTGTDDNQIMGNLIGLAPDRLTPLPNKGFGIANVAGAVGTLIEANTIAHNQNHGIWIAAAARTRVKSNVVQANQGDGIGVDTCAGNTVSRNVVYQNEGAGIRSACPPAPVIAEVRIGANEAVTGTALPNATIEIFSDHNEEAQFFEASVTADSVGAFSYTKSGRFVGNNLTATLTDAEGNTSSLALPAHLQWTVLLYLNGDNDLDKDFVDMIEALASSGPSPRANVLALLDRAGSDNTTLYDLTRGELTPLRTNERDMGDQQTLVEFVADGRGRYPARHTMLSIVDHGGGWAPNSDAFPSDSGLLVRRHFWLAGGSGLSWDETSDHSYMDSNEIASAMRAISNNGTTKLDIAFFDVCLMGMVEVAYQIKDDARFFISSQNVAWAPVGAHNRYVRLIHGLKPLSTPQELAQLTVESYAASMPVNEHPYSISAVDLAKIPNLVTALDNLATQLKPKVTNAAQAAAFREAYVQTQKIDYDADLRVEAETDGFVDVYDLATRIEERYNEPAIDSAARGVKTALTAAVTAIANKSDYPWMRPATAEWFWDLDKLHGLSIFLPLGEDLRYCPPGIGDPTQCRLTQRDTYTGDLLRFVQDTQWKSLIEAYESAKNVPVLLNTPNGPVQVLPPDVTPPQTIVLLTGTRPSTLTWNATDAQSGVLRGELWERQGCGEWVLIKAVEGASGTFTHDFPTYGGLAVRSVDMAGNLEPLQRGVNMFEVTLCQNYAPLVGKL